MISISPWFERSFRFDLEPRYFPLVLERLYGTTVRLEHAVRHVSESRLIERPDGAWSIQEHVGHLVDLEPLWLGRVHDIAGGVHTMRPADLTNRATYDAGHNERDLQELLSDFARQRGLLTDRLSGLSVDDAARSALHPRLKQPMRIIDLAIFVAEHDDHHLATIRERLS